MIKRLSIDSRKMILFSAAAEVWRRGDRRLGTDHLLLGLLHEPGSEISEALGITLDGARKAFENLDRRALKAVGIEVERLTSPPPHASSSHLPPLTSGARAVFKKAIDEARPTKTGRIEIRHFALALLASKLPDPAAELFKSLGVDADAARARLLVAGEQIE